MKKQLYIISGPNGEGKTTVAYILAPEFLAFNEFVNADEIAKGISPFNPDGVAMKSGRIMLERINYLFSQKQNFAIETTLSGLGYVRLIENCKKQGYEVTLIFLWLPSHDFAVNRVKNRVQQGGHNIPTETIIRRYSKGIKNLIKVYIPLCNHVTIYNAAINHSFDDNPYQLIAKKYNNGNIEIIDQIIWQRIEEQSK